MQTANYTFRVRYGETDKMGFVYYGNYAEYFEVGRVELFRKMGVSYQKLEDEKGLLMPVLNLTINYLHPLYYDQEFVLKTTLTKVEGLKVFFEYEIQNSEGKICTKGSTILIFISKENSKPVRVPEEIFRKLDNK